MEDQNGSDDEPAQTVIAVPTQAATDSSKTRPLAASSAPPLVEVGTATLEEQPFESRYAELHLLGRGGMGEVRLCTDHRIGRQIAMKVVRSGEGSVDDLVPRFVREARVQGQLEHPAIVPVHDLGLNPGGAAYFTMQRVRGETLEQILRGLRKGDAETQAKHTRRRLLAAFSKVCLALDFAHSRGVVHRDVKPANVMLGDFGEVFVLDWGLAKTRGADEAVSDATPESLGDLGSNVETMAGAILGTPGYMAPEQFLQATSPVDGRADVYALGSLLFELLTLKQLHPTSDAQELFERTVQGTSDARPSKRVPEADVPPELEAICVRATAVEPEDRFPTARALSEAVEQYLDGDRDLELRRNLAADHAEKAQTLLAQIRENRGPAIDERKRAMRELSRAIALDPDNPDAMRTLVELMMTLPDELPDEVSRELDDLQVQQVKVGGKAGIPAYLSFNLYLPGVLWMGVKQWLLVAIFTAGTVLAAASSFLVARMKRPHHALAVLAVSSLPIGVIAGLASPFVLVPAIAAANTLVYSLNHTREYRWPIIGVGSLAFVVPLLFEWAGWIPPSYRFVEDGLLLVPRFAWMPELATLALLTIGSFAVIITAALSVAPFRNELDDAQRNIRLQAWHLRQLVPDAALRETVSSSDP